MADIYEKIRKLLNLSASDFKSEAESALKKAYDLMHSQNITMKDLEAKEALEKLGPLGEFNVDSPKKYFKWEITLMATLARLFDCMVYKSTIKRLSKLFVVGREENVRTAIAFFFWISEKTKKEVENLFRNNRPEWTSYCLGVTLAISKKVDQLKISETQNSSENSLMLLDEVQTYFFEKHPSVSSVSIFYRNPNKEALQKGLKVGESISLNKQFCLKEIESK